MKSYLFVFCSTLLLSGCVQPPQRQPSDTPVQQERVSDHYSRSKVRSYEVFDADIADHVIMLVRLTAGEQFPMMCRKTGSGIYPIAQSVFAEPGVERWSMMCEPRIHDSYSLMKLDLSRVDGVLFIRDRKLKSAAKLPLLSSPSL